MKKIVALMGIVLFSQTVYSQTESDSLRMERLQLDSLFIREVEEQKPYQKPKVFHAEPLYIDLIRDLGARKGEKEWNLGGGMTEKNGYYEYEALVEYEWAPIDRLGFEIEVPVAIFSTRGRPDVTGEIPQDRIESLKLATQWSFLVSEKAQTTLALGYIHEFEFVDLNKMGSELFRGNVYNPFFIAAKRWSTNYHTLIYTGPRIVKEFNHRREFSYEIHSNFHYMITGTRNFIGIELNKEIHNGQLQAVMRPQMRVGLAENLMVGIVTGIPVLNANQGMSSFIRIIYEPGFRTFH